MPFLFLFFVLSICYSQKYDYQWPFGDGDDFSIGFGISTLNFYDSEITTTPYAEVPVFELSNAGSFICNNSGEIVLMTNNCEVFNHNFEVIPNGDTVTPGIIYNDYCESGDYPSSQVSLFLPSMYTDSIVYLLHKDEEIWDAKQDVVSRKLYCSTIVQKADSSFYLKDKKVLYDDVMITSRLTAVTHSDGKRWWTWTAGYDSNVFYKYLIGGQNGVEGPFEQAIGIPLKNKELSIGQTAFSPDATKLAINNEKHGVMLYDFNNTTGELSNYKSIPYENMETAEGLVFSPDSRFIYTNTAEDMYQIDLQNNDEVVHLGHYRSQAPNGWPVGLGSMYLGPDCRIYVSSGTTTPFIHVIHHPNAKGKDCTFEERAIYTPTRLEFDLPNIPMYRFNGSCDSTLVWKIPVGVEEVAKEKKGMHVTPNPVQHTATIVLPEAHSCTQLHICTISGSVVQKIDVLPGQRTLHLSTAPWPSGMYFVSAVGTDILSFKFVVLEQGN